MNRRSNNNSMYQIRIREKLDLSPADWMDEGSVIPQENGETLLVGRYVDQSALRGLLERLWDHNFTVLALEIVDQKVSPQI